MLVQLLDPGGSELFQDLCYLNDEAEIVKDSVVVGSVSISLIAWMGVGWFMNTDCE